MSSFILPAIGAGISAGAVMIFFSHVMPFFAATDYVHVDDAHGDEPRIFGKKITRREGHFIGVFAHLILSGVFAGLYAWLVGIGLFGGFSFLALLAWSLALTVFMGLIVFPLEGHGLFGLKEDAWFPLDLLITNFLWAILFWWLMHLWFTVGIVG